ncbi:MAG: NTP transferase domain-containing protein, partial [Deltaproteobacteria bacterium]|nr:NTP transferase domain-containing protein [Deltaproteobacteria bacterium]
QPDMIIVSVYDERRGNPVLFPKSMRSDLLALTGDSGGRQIMAHMPERVIELAFDDAGAGIDIDTPESYSRIVKR